MVTYPVQCCILDRKCNGDMQYVMSWYIKHEILEVTPFGAFTYQCSASHTKLWALLIIWVKDNFILKFKKKKKLFSPKTFSYRTNPLVAEYGSFSTTTTGNDNQVTNLHLQLQQKGFLKIHLNVILSYLSLLWPGVAINEITHYIHCPLFSLPILTRICH